MFDANNNISYTIDYREKQSFLEMLQRVLFNLNLRKVDNIRLSTLSKVLGGKLNLISALYITINILVINCIMRVPQAG